MRKRIIAMENMGMVASGKGGGLREWGKGKGIKKYKFVDSE